MMQNTSNDVRSGGKYTRMNEPHKPLIKPKRWTYLQNRFDLTPRERQIAELVCCGMRNEDIASELEISAGTAKTHIRNIYRKVHVKSKISMLLMFIAESECLID